MAPGAKKVIQHVNDKGKGPALDAVTLIDTTIDLQPPDICVICLDRISEQATALPCKHDQFDFPCLGTWIQQSRICPLCKAEVKAIKYGDERDKTTTRIFHLPTEDLPRRSSSISETHERRSRRATISGYHPYRRSTSTSTTTTTRPRNPPSRDWGERPTNLTDRADNKALEFRKQVYRRRMYSAYVGANRISRYRNVTPRSFVSDAALVNRAKTFIRRELQVFDFLNPSGSAEASSSLSGQSQKRGDRRADNAEFLLEYIVGILKSIDLKGSTGQAEELLKDFLGRENARLFLHELEAWLRGPYERLSDWDRHVQYSDGAAVGESSGAQSTRSK